MKRKTVFNELYDELTSSDIKKILKNCSKVDCSKLGYVIFSDYDLSTDYLSKVRKVIQTLGYSYMKNIVACKKDNNDLYGKQLIVFPLNSKTKSVVDWDSFMHAIQSVMQLFSIDHIIVKEAESDACLVGNLNANVDTNVDILCKGDSIEEVVQSYLDKLGLEFVMFMYNPPSNIMNAHCRASQGELFKFTPNG